MHNQQVKEWQIEHRKQEKEKQQEKIQESYSEKRPKDWWCKQKKKVLATGTRRRHSQRQENQPSNLLSNVWKRKTQTSKYQIRPIHWNTNRTATKQQAKTMFELIMFLKIDGGLKDGTPAMLDYVDDAN